MFDESNLHRIDIKYGVIRSKELEVVISFPKESTFGEFQKSFKLSL